MPIRWRLPLALALTNLALAVIIGLFTSLQTALIVWAVLLLPTLAVAYLLTRSLTRPLERLRQMTARVAAGDFAYRTSVHSSDEMGGLAQSLNSMAAQLESRAHDLRVESERSEQVLAAMSEGVVLIDGEGRLLRSNPAAERILGVRLAGMEGVPLVSSARMFPARAFAQAARAAGHTITQVLDLPGPRYLTVDVAPLSQPFGSAEGQTLFVIRDETGRRAIESVRRDFATNVSHELKTPLAGLSLLAATLGNAIREDPEQASQFVTRLSAEIGRLTELTNDLLTLSRLEDPQGSLATAEAINVNALAAETLEELRPVAENKRQTLSYADSGEAVVVQGEELSLRTLLRNLLDNAIRYTEAEGHISLTIEAQTDQTGRRWALIKVTDDGVGIPLADQQRIFERFYRVDKARSRETGGTGLGLSIVKHVAERHGGSVEVKSTLGVGSTFSVRLPTA
jgi:two-component system phosphate regulon sensor histidine kinase PhoR